MDIICVYCFDKENDNSIIHRYYCYECNKFARICESCVYLRPIIFVTNSTHHQTVYYYCSLKCSVSSVIGLSQFKILEIYSSNILKEQQEEILYESRKNAIKLIIQPLNYFINDILCEIMEY